MEGLVILVVLALVGGVIILPLVAFVRSGRAIREAEHLRQKIVSIENELRWLKRQFGSQPTTPPTPEVALGSFVSTEPPLSAAPDLPESPTPVPPHEVVAASLAALVAQPVADPHSTNATPPPLPPVFAAPPAVAASTPVSTPSGRQLPKIDWEQFMGVKLFAWLGGFALFLAVGYFVKYSFERDLIPPEVRVALGFLIGLGLLVGGVVLK